MRWLFPATALLAVLALVTGAAYARPNSGRRVRPVEHDGSSVSIGRPNRGRLLDGRLLAESDHVRYRSGRAIQRWGTDELVQTLQNAAQHVSLLLPGAKLTVGDLSRREGGRFRPHRSHRNGRDADIAFYMNDQDGEPAYPLRFARFRRNGRSPQHDLRFDDARNWELVSALVTNDKAPVQYIFVARDLQQRLLAEAARREAPQDVVDRARTVMSQPRRGGRHDDHFHVRVYCAQEDRPICRDAAPFHAWYAPEAPELHAALRLGPPGFGGR